MTVIVRDLGWNRILHNTAELDGLQLKVGVNDDAGNEPSGEPVASVAAYMEFGTEKIPPRPFMRKTIDENARVVDTKMAGYLRAIYAGQVSSRTAVIQLGRWFADQIRETIDDSTSWAVPNSPNTVQRKGFQHPLIDSGTLRGSITSRLE